jgi:Family of unknown function (DUF6334)
MVTNEFPIGQALVAVSFVEDKEFASEELCCDKIQFMFKDTIITLLPLADTDEIEIIKQTHTNLSAVDTPHLWCDFIGKKLMNVWVCENDQGYQDQFILAFGNLHPSIAFIAEGSVIKAFRYEQICRSKSNLANNFKGVET